MASATLISNSGTKLRTASQRRYVVVVEYVVGKPYVAYRTDVLARAKARASRRTPYNDIVFDTTTREAVQ